MNSHNHSFQNFALLSYLSSKKRVFLTLAFILSILLFLPNAYSQAVCNFQGDIKLVNGTPLDGDFVTVHNTSDQQVGSNQNHPTLGRYSYNILTTDLPVYFKWSSIRTNEPVITTCSIGGVNWLNLTVNETTNDLDGDGYNDTQYGGNDCNDTNPNINPGANEICNGIDDNCDTQTDENGNALCDDGYYCNGVEICSGLAGCQQATPPNCDDAKECTNDICNETLDQCENPLLQIGTLCGQARDCPDDACNGFFAEFYPDDGHDTCDGAGNCITYSCALQDSYCTDNDPNDGINSLECGAECDSNADCDDFNSSTRDSCNLNSCICEYELPTKPIPIMGDALFGLLAIIIGGLGIYCSKK